MEKKKELGDGTCILDFIKLCYLWGQGKYFEPLEGSLGDGSCILDFIQLRYF